MAGNHLVRVDDLALMRCDDCREATSARLDNEALPPGIDERSVEAHIRSCPACTAWVASGTTLHRSLRIRTAVPVPDLTDRVLANVPLTSRPRPVRQGVRYVLFAIGLTQLLLSLPTLLLGGDTSAPVHIAREMGAFELALGVGLLSAAWRPRLAIGLLPFAGALAGAMAVTAVLDVVQGRALAAGEAHHVLDLSGVLFLWLVQSRPGQALRGRLDLVQS